MKRNKWIILCLAGCLALALSACASQNGSDDSSDSSDGNKRCWLLSAGTGDLSGIYRGGAGYLSIA